MNTPSPAPLVFSVRQQTILYALGIGFWFLAAMIVRLLGSILMQPASPLVAVAFLSCIPLSFVFLFSAKAVLGLKPGQYVRSMAIMTGIAAIFDGICLTWFPGLYHPDPEIVKQGGFVILEGAGIGLLVAHLMAQRSPEQAAQ